MRPISTLLKRLARPRPAGRDSSYAGSVRAEDYARAARDPYVRELLTRALARRSGRNRAS